MFKNTFVFANTFVFLCKIRCMRYFILTFIASQGNAQVTGNITTSRKTFPSRKDITKVIAEIEKCTQVVITNIIEITEEDYNNWNA